MNSVSPPPLPRKRASAYSRSRCFRWGLWALAWALLLILWGAVRDSMTAKDGSLIVLEGVVLEERSTESGGPTTVRIKSGGSNRIQGQASQHTYLKVRSREGLVKEFDEPEWYPTPKAGWVNQPVRLEYDSFDRLYGIEVAGEVIRSAEETRRYRKIDNRKSSPLIVFLIITGVPMVVIGFLLSLLHRPAPQPPTGRAIRAESD